MRVSFQKIEKKHVHAGLAALVVVVLVLLSILRPFAVPRAEAWFSDYKFRRLITFDRALVPTTQTNFPVLVSFSDPDLKLDSDCAVSIDGPCSANGWDIVFTDTSDVQLAYEIESYTSDATNGTIVMWVLIQTLNGVGAPSDTSIYMYYGKNGVISSTENRDAVWDTNYQGVWHMANTGAGAGAFTDSSGTSPANNGTGNGTKLVSVSSPTSKIGRAWGFNATTPADSYVDMGNPASLFDDDTTGSGFTVEAWIKRTLPTSNAFGHYILSDYSSTANQSSFSLRVNGTNVPADQDKIAFFWENPSGTLPLALSTTVTSQGSWYHVVGVWDAASVTRRIYINGGREGTNVGAQTRTDVGGNTAIARAGSFTDTTFYAFAEVDEVRFSNTARTADWILTEYRNQQNQGCRGGAGCASVTAGAFILSLGGEEQSNPPPTTPVYTEVAGRAFPNFYSSVATPVLGNFSSTDTDPIEYEIQWDDNVTCDSPLATRLIPGTFASGVEVSYQVVAGDGLVNGSTYWWCVHARNVAGPWSAFSTPRSFTVNTALPPGTDAWYQTTSDQFTTTLTDPDNILTDTEAAPGVGPAGGAKLKGW